MRDTDSGIGYSNLNIIITFVALQGNTTAGWSELCSIVNEGIYHEECKCLVGLHYRCSVAHRQCYAARFEQLAALFYDGKQAGKREALDLQIHLALTHLYPSFKDNVKVIEFFRQFGNVTQFTFLITGSCILKHTQFIHYPVNVWTHGHHCRYRHAFEQILAFVFLEIHCTGTAHLLKTFLLIYYIGKAHTLANSNSHIGYEHFKQ